MVMRCACRAARIFEPIASGVLLGSTGKAFMGGILRVLVQVVRWAVLLSVTQHRAIAFVSQITLA
ncbi:hypothetical protein GCM10009596_19420 [Arthrobacter rhombi]